MGLLVLVVAGAILGWLASVVTRIEKRQDILLNVAVGIVGALVAGLLVNNGALLGFLKPESLLAGLAGAIVALVMLGAIRHVVIR